MPAEKPSSVRETPGSFSGSVPTSGGTEAAEPLEDTELSRKLLAITALRVGLVTFSLGALVALAQLESRKEGSNYPNWEYGLVAATYSLSLLYALGLRRRGMLQLLAYAQVVLDAVIVSVLVMMTGGVESIFSFAYVFVVLGACTTLYRRGALLATATASLMYGTILGLQVDRSLAQLPVVETSKAILSFFMQCVGTTLAGILASSLSEKARTTGRRLREKQTQFRRLEELHSVILRSLPAGLLMVDAQGLIRYANEAALYLLRLGRDGLDGQELSRVIPAIGLSLKRRRGPLSIAPERWRERYEDTHLRADGVSIRLGYSFAPLTGEHGLSTLVVFQDVTEIVRLKESFERAERLATVGKFAAGLAHEVRNPLAAICASIDVLKGTLSPPEPMQRLMTNVVHEAERLDQLISDFLVFARPRPLRVQLADLGAVVFGVVEVFRHETVERKIRLITQLDRGVLAAIDEDVFRQVVWNLLRNAAEAMSKGGGDLMVEVTNTPEGPTLRVRDTGPGIPADLLKRVFDPFFTTKERGSGLGLAITHSVVEAHRARLSIESREDVGTEVTVRLRSELDAADLLLQSRANEDDAGELIATDELDLMVSR